MTAIKKASIKLASVDRIGEFSNHFISDLQSLAALSLDDNEEEQNNDQPNIESKEEKE